MLLLQESLFSLTRPLQEEVLLPVTKPAPLFITILFILLLVVLSLFMIHYSHNFKLMYKAVFLNQPFSFNKNNNNLEQLYLFLIITFCIIEALSFYCIINYLKIPIFNDTTPEKHFCVGLGCFALYYAIYFSMTTFINWLFNFQAITVEHISNKISHHLMASICIFPFLALTCYNYQINLSVLLLCFWTFFYILLIYKQTRLYIKNVGLFYFFLYFCTIEILPVLIIGKLYFVLGK